MYIAEEDEWDGYRSCLGELRLVDREMENVFPAERVIGTMDVSASSCYSDDVLTLVSAGTGKRALRVGTANFDDYYPWFVGEYNPENLSVNA